MSKTLLYVFALANLAGFILVIVMNFMANSVPINGKTTGELSALYPNLFVPAGATFAIWGIIYLLLTAFVIFQGVAVFTGNPAGSQAVEKIELWFLISCLMNASWILAWHYQQVGLSLLIMLGLLASLLVMYQRLSIGLGDASPAIKFLVHLPLSVYLGWISIATIANVTAYLVHLGWNGWGISQQAWALVMIAAGVILAFLMLYIRYDLFYALVIAWALYGIWLKRSAATEPAPLVSWGALLGLILVGAAILALLIFKRGKGYL